LTAIALSLGLMARAEGPAKPDALNFTVKDIDGKDVDLSSYSGKVILMLNVSSRCGNTPQYTALESLYEKYKDKGFVIIGFPANNFGGQEPGTNAQIKEFCTADDSKYHITFPLMSKISVKGDDIHPLFKYLTNQDCKPLSKGDIKWNFEKFLISKDGKLIGRFGNRTQPDDKSIVEAIEAALK
jgi:glutathione peroxidase